MTDGARAGTSGDARGWPDWAVAIAWLAGLTLLVNCVNVLSIVEEHARDGEQLAWWRPAVWEGTSGLAILAVATLPMWAVQRFPPGRGWRWRGPAVHLAALAIFSLAHVGLMIALRHLAYALAGERYAFAGGLGALDYEFRKDLISYIAIAGLFWAVPRLRRPLQLSAPLAAPLPPVDMIEIDEGQRIIRVPHADLLCARSSGNYVEFFLADGRRPLMRTTLARAEAALAGTGVVRTHRSWLVNPRAVVEIVAEGSGDYGLTLSDGTQVPLSRRYPGALTPLRRGTLLPAK